MKHDLTMKDDEVSLSDLLEARRVGAHTVVVTPAGSASLYARLQQRIHFAADGSYTPKEAKWGAIRIETETV